MISSEPSSEESYCPSDGQGLLARLDEDDEASGGDPGSDGHLSRLDEDEVSGGVPKSNDALFDDERGGVSVSEDDDDEA